MADFNTQEQDENNYSQYKQLKQQAASLASQVNAWQGTFDSLRATVSAEDQAILDSKRAQFVNQLKASLGL
jgi:hypothetical protein